MIPAEFVGVWTRTEMILDGTPLSGAGAVIWIQGPSIFVDVRAPGGPGNGTAFAGHTTWQPSVLTWHHDLDQSTEPSADSGRVRWDGRDLIEEGENAFGARAYFERWQRLDEGGPVHEVIGENSISLRSGRHAAAVTDTGPDNGFAACYWRRTGGVWIPSISIGDARLLPDPSARSGAQLPLNTVVEILRASIAQGRFAPGDRLSEGGLAAELGSTRDTVREALRILGSEPASKLRAEPKALWVVG